MARVMIADDSKATRLVLQDMLSFGKHELVGEAKDGAEAVEKFNVIKPDILLLDLAMPKKDGLTVINEIRAASPDAKIIVITVNEKAEIMRDCIAAGALAYILKPFKIDNVLQIISSALQRNLKS